jgi:serine/threonine protein kinase
MTSSVTTPPRRPDPPSSFTTSPTAQDQLIESLAEEMITAWHRGERPGADLYLNQRPELWESPEAALELIAEELALREEFRVPTATLELENRFPKWISQVRTLRECQRMLEPHWDSADFQLPVAHIGNFQLIQELGRGAHGRVYLATQPELAGRPVVLKIGPALGGEHLSLARLQHTHIVPLYSVHELPERGQRALCMPYFGSTTLAKILAKPESNVGTSRLGEFGNWLRQAQTEEETIYSSPGSTAHFLDQANIPEAICWIGANLADALQYAHVRNLIHFDIKASNVLIASDGVPMLLDFHLARGPLKSGQTAPPHLGGTPGFMAPEHEAALKAAQRGLNMPADVDGRADIYSLGILLRELLSLQKGNSAVSIPVGLNDILDRCTEKEASRRYDSAGELANDLRRQLTNLPLKGVSNRSLMERWSKWRKRRPYAFPLVLITLALGCISLAVWLSIQRIEGDINATRRDALRLMDNEKYSEAVETFRIAERLAGRIPFNLKMRNELLESRHRAEKGQAAKELHDFISKSRPLLATEQNNPEQLRQVLQTCQMLWYDRQNFYAKLNRLPTRKMEETRDRDFLDLALLCSELSESLSTLETRPQAHQQSLQILEEASQLLGSSRGLLLQQVRHLKALNRDAEAEEMLAKAAGKSIRSAWSYLYSGKALLELEDYPQAVQDLNQSLSIDPNSVWANFYLGNCYLKMDQTAEAIAAYSACVALAPEEGWCRYNRGLAYLAAHRFDSANADFEKALMLDPYLVAAHLGKASVYQQQSRWAEAATELDRAQDGGRIPLADVEYRRALNYLLQDKRPEAIASLKRALQQDPKHLQAQMLLKQFKQ